MSVYGSLSLPRPNKTNQFFNVIKVIIVTHDSFSVIDNSSFFVSFQTIQKLLNAVPACKFCKSPSLNLLCI